MAKRTPKIVLKIAISPELQDVAEALTKKGHEVQVMEDLADYDLVIGPSCGFYPEGGAVDFVDSLLRGAAARKAMKEG